MQIAAFQKQELDFLRGTLDGLLSVSGKAELPAFEELRDRLDGWAAKVAVIGQVKAGKSTFLNAFLNETELLPSDVNPWTSVVTNMRINLPNDPASGATFRFYDEAAWNEILTGTTEIRKLAEQLLPGFDTALLRRQTEAMRERAQRRLGDHYETLLGTSHSYEVATPHLLQRYVCAGSSPELEHRKSAPGRYSSITRSADLYLRLPEFQVPVVVTDTPGVNDPFLVRDEFTCRSLDRSDIFIVVLSAHQPLTEVDIALLRILAQQDTKDVLIFINRIDELDEYDADVPLVIDDVAQRLRAAIPDVEFTIQAGSAYLAVLALRHDEEAELIRDALDDGQLADYLRSRFGHVPANQRDRFMLASGMGEIKRALSTIIDHGTGCRQLKQLLEDMRAEIAGQLFAAKRERESVQLQAEKAGAEETRAQLETEFAALTQLGKTLEDLQDRAALEIDKVVNKSWTALETSLNTEVGQFIHQISDRLTDIVRYEQGYTDALDIDLTPLHNRMDETIRSQFERSRAATDVLLNNCLGATLGKIREQFDDLDEGITLDQLPFDEFASTLAVSKRQLNIALVKQRSWRFWRGREIDADATLSAIRSLIAMEIRPAIAKILKAFNEAQTERADAGKARLRVALRAVEAATAARKQRLNQSQLESTTDRVSDPDRGVQQAHRMQSELEVLERRLQHLAIHDSNLARASLAHAA